MSATTTEWDGFVGRFKGTMLAQYPGLVSNEVAEGFDLTALEALPEIERTWDDSKGRAFDTYAWQKLKWLWFDETRKVRVQRAEISRGHRLIDRRGHPIRKKGQRIPNDVPLALRGKAPAGVRWVNTTPYTAAMKSEVRKRIGPVVVNGFFGTNPHRDLTETEAKASGYHVFGAGYPQALGMWDHGDCDGLLFTISGSVVWNTDGTGSLHRLTHREVGELMGTGRNGYPYDPKAIAQILSDAAKKLGCAPDKITYVVHQGILQTRIRRMIEAENRGYAKGQITL